MHRLASILALASVASIACAASDALAADAPETHVALPSVGITFDAPAGWTRRPERSPSQLAQFAHVEKNAQTGVIDVEIKPAKGLTVQALADQLAKSNGGKIVAGDPLPGGAVQLTLPPDKPFAANAVAVRLLRDQAIVITSEAADATAAAAALRSIVASIVTSDPTSAAETLTPLDRPIALFNSPVTLSLPEAFRPIKSDKPDASPSFAAHDWLTGKDECSIAVQLLPNPKGLPIDEVARASSATLTAKLHLAPPMTSTHVNSAPATAISSPFTAAGDQDVQRIVWTRLDGRLDGQRDALLIFRTTAADAGVRDKYVALAESVAKALKISKLVASTRPSAASPTKP